MTCGIYKIYCNRSQRSYIGSAVKIDVRWRDHKRMLRNNRHYNKFLQADWNKCGEASFEFGLLEETNRETRMTREQVWLDKHFDHQQYCYNIQPFAGTCRGRVLSAETKAKISAKHKGRSNVAAVKTFDVKLVAPDGKIYGPIVNLEAFSKMVGLNSSGLWLLIHGQKKTYNGWRLQGTPDNATLLKQRGEKISNAKKGTKRPDVFERHAKVVKRFLVSPDGKKVWLEKGIVDFAKKHGLCSSTLSKLLNGKQKKGKHKGWKLA